MFIRKNFYSIYKRHYLLLEVLIALVLVILCAIPLFRPHLFLYTEERNFLRELDLDRAVHLLHIHTVEALYRNEISWDTFQDIQKHKIETDPLIGLKEEGIRIIQSVKTNQKENFHLLEIRYVFDTLSTPSKEYTFYIGIRNITPIPKVSTVIPSNEGKVS